MSPDAGTVDIDKMNALFGADRGASHCEIVELQHRMFKLVYRSYFSHCHLNAFARASSCSAVGGLIRYEFAPSE